VESFKREVDEKFTQMVATATTQAAAIDDLKIMFANYMKRSDDRAQASPSITESALENEGSGEGAQGDAGVPQFGSRRKGYLVKKSVDKNAGRWRPHKAISGGGDQLASKAALTLSSDSEIPTAEFRKPTSPRWKVAEREASPPTLPTAEVFDAVAAAQPAPIGSVASPDPYHASPEIRTSSVSPASAKADSPVDVPEDLEPLHKDVSADALVSGEAAPETSTMDVVEEETTDVVPEADPTQSSEERAVECGNVEGSPDGGGDGGFQDASNDRVTATNVAVAPSRKAKKAPKSPSKVCISQHRSPCAFIPGVPFLTLQDLVTNKVGGSSMHSRKLVIFNVQGTLLDCSLLAAPNPNCSIRYTLKTKSRRVVFRPWLKHFLDRCFSHFKVAFWGSRGAPYMADVVPAMLDGFYSRAGDKDPLFCWSCSANDGIGGEQGKGTSGEKKLSEVYARYPQFNAENTVIVDSKICRVLGNAQQNVLITSPFYVKWLRTLGNDKQYLKSYLWPLLEAFWRCPDVTTFRAKYPEVVNESKSQWLLKRKRGTGYDFVDMVGGEGTCRPPVSNTLRPSPSFLADC
jgi:hypothetical protein